MLDAKVKELHEKLPEHENIGAAKKTTFKGHGKERTTDADEQVVALET